LSSNIYNKLDIPSKRRRMKQYNISSIEVWERTLKLNASLEIINDLIKDMTDEIHVLKRISYELKEIEKHENSRS